MPRTSSIPSKGGDTPVPSHVTSFQKINAKITDHLMASVAFGVFMRAESCWLETNEPNEANCRTYHSMLTDFQIDRIRDDATRILNEYANRIVEEKRAEFLDEMSRHHKGFRRWGVWEAFLGSFFWTAVLIAVSIIVQRAGIDILEVYKHATGAH
jgi:hypothetical protein